MVQPLDMLGFENGQKSEGMDISEHYFEHCMTFLFEYKWLYNFSNTHLLVENVFSKFSDEWKDCLHSLSYEELRLLPSGYIRETWPPSFRTFLNRLSSLKPKFLQQNVLPCDISEDFVDKDGRIVNLKQHAVGMSKKKQHEVANLVKFIDKYCDGINTIVDVGSGLGYLSQYLHAKYNCFVMGIEADESKLQSALARQRKWFPETLNQVRYVQHRVTKRSTSEIGKFLDETKWDLSKGVCLVGLHTCGDLALSAVDIFIDSDLMRKLIIMPCCYHKMEFSSDGGASENFRNFPVSRELKTKCNNLGAESFLRRPFLRLACQQRPGAWKDINSNELQARAFRLLSRAVLELYVHQENLILVKNKRKAVKSQGHVDSFEKYLDDVRSGYTLKDMLQNGKVIAQNDAAMAALWNTHRGTSALKLSAGLIALQACLQPVCENILLLDKISRLDEAANITASQFVQIADEALSSRCFCLLSSKTE